MPSCKCNIYFKFALRQVLFSSLFNYDSDEVYAGSLKTESPSIFSCLLLSQIFALVYPLGVLTVESQDRKCSIQYLKYSSSGSKVSPINRNEKTSVSKRHMPNRILTEFPSLFSCFPHIRVSALDYRFDVCQSSHKINFTQHTLLRL